MASHAFMCFLSIGLYSCVLSISLSTGDLQSGPNAMKDAKDDSSFIENTGDVCHDCTQIFGLLADLLSSADIEKKMMDGMDPLCDHLPGPAGVSSICREEVAKRLPQAISFLTGVKPAEACRFIGLCTSCGQQERMLSYFVQEALRAAVTSENGRPAAQCSLCVFIFKTLEDLLPKERTEAVVRELLGTLCHIVPSFYRHECEAIIGKISKTVLDAILRCASPKAICILLHQCKGQEVAPPGPCTLPEYRCRDMSTALRCGAVFSCQRFEWQPLDYNRL